MIDLVYEWNDDNYYFCLYELLEGRKKLIKTFEDREDLLIYIEKNYTMANLIVRGD